MVYVHIIQQCCIATLHSNVLPHHTAMFYCHIIQQCSIATLYSIVLLPHLIAMLYCHITWQFFYCLTMQQCCITTLCSNAVSPHHAAVTLYLTACLSVGNIRVFCRVRPPIKEDGHNVEVVANFDPDDDTVVHICQQGRTHSFQFDRVFSHDSTQAEV